MSSPDPTPESPIYMKVAHQDGWATQLFMIVCDEGWRQSIVCDHMYDWAADWLLSLIGDAPYAPQVRPGS